MTKVIIKSEDNQKEIVIFAFLSPEEIKKAIKKAEKEKLPRMLNKLLEMLKSKKSPYEIKKEMNNIAEITKYLKLN